MNEDPTSTPRSGEARGTSGHRESVLDGVPRDLPSLPRASRLSDEAASVGFDWPVVDGVVDKIREEFDELDEALRGHGDVMHEYGDLLFALANLGRFIGADPEASLQAANERFIRRFGHIERSLAARARPIAEASLDEMEALWQAAKQLEREGD
jgi:nucleoside triphosphate diphosphatase